MICAQEELTGRIKGKYIFDKVLSLREKEKIERDYSKIHLWWKGSFKEEYQTKGMQCK